MMPDEHADPHDTFRWREEIATRQSETEKVVNGLAVSVSRMEQSITDIVGALKGLAQDQRIDRKPFQWSVAISFATLVLGIAGAFTTLTIIPLRDQLGQNTASVAAIAKSNQEAARWQGSIDGRWEERTNRLSTIEAMLIRMKDDFDKSQTSGAYTYGRIEAGLDLIRDVDVRGSRRFDTRP